MSTNSIPQPRQPIAGSLPVDATWYRWLRDLERLANQADADISAEIEALCRKLGSPDGTISGIPDPSAPELVGESPVSVNGTVIGLETIGNVSGGTPQAVTVDAYGRVTQRRPIEPDEIPEDFRVWLTDETGAYLTDELGNFLCVQGVDLPGPVSVSGVPLGTAAFRNIGTSGATVPLLSAANTFSAGQVFTSNLQAASFGGAGVRFFQFSTDTLSRWRLSVTATAETGSNAGSDFALNRFDDSGALIGAALTVTRSSGIVSIPSLTATSFTYGGITQAVVQAGTVTGQICFWSQTAGRYEAAADLTRNGAGQYAARAAAASQPAYILIENSIVRSSYYFDPATSSANIAWYNASGTFQGNAVSVSNADGRVTVPLLTIGANATSAIQSGTINGQLARWSTANSRWEPVTAAGLVNAANDAGAAGAGVPVSGLYRNGSVLQIRVV